MLKLLLVVLLAAFPVLVLAAPGGSVSGVIFDKQTGEYLVGVNVAIAGTARGASTDLNGKYSIANIDAGKITLKVTYVGYTPKTIVDVEVKEGQTSRIDVSMNSEAIQGEEVVITAERIRSTEAAALAERKKASGIGDAITSEQIKRTPDATSSDALKRVTGISVVDNKFVYVRGITDRYNGTTLDGATVSGSEMGRKSFAFDVIPAGLLENTNVVKSATPDLPGDFTGGLVQMSTLDVPDRFIGRLSLSSSYNSLTTSQNIVRTLGGAKDWLGIDDGTRDLPAVGLPQNTWGHRNTRAPYNGGFSLAAGDNVPFGKSEGSGGQLGYVAAFTYRNSFQRNEKYFDDKIQLMTYDKGQRDDYSVLWGGIANFTYKSGDGLHKISFKNNYNRTADDQITHTTGIDGANGYLNDYTLINYNQRSLYNGQLTGEHALPYLDDATMLWKATVSSAARQEPDRKELFYQQSVDFPDLPARAGQNRRGWNKTNDRTLGFGVDFVVPLSTSKIKFGGLTQKKTTNYWEEYFNVPLTPYNNTKDSIFQLPIERVYDPSNFGPGRLQFVPLADPNHNKNIYEGDSQLFAFYLMTDVPFTVAENHFRVSGGARLENVVQNINSPGARPEDQHNQLKNVDVLPSINFTYMFSDIGNLRLAYSHSVNRPEFRERSLVIFEDILTKVLYGGNKDLQRAYIRNYDVRVELFPGIGELLAASFFRKDFSGAIEESMTGGSNRSVIFVNSPSAESFGWEFEVRKSFDFLGEYMSNLSVNFNYTRIQSKVEYSYDETDGTGSGGTRTVVATRPLYGQSPYMINASIFFREPTLGTSVNIAYNVFGRRLQRVGGTIEPDTYEEPRDLADISLTQPVMTWLEAKVTIKNLNGKDRILSRDGSVYDRVSTGTTYGLQLSFSM